MMTRNKSIMMGTMLGILFMVSMLFLATAEAQNLGTPGTNHYGGSHNGIGGCSKDGKWCWNIHIDQPHGHKPWPREVWGRDAIRLMSNSQIVQANMNHYGIMYLGVYDRDGWHWDCQVNPQRNRYSCRLDF